jgi:REP element-mobilizing transposase RayT
MLRQTTGRDARFFERTPKRCVRVTDSRSCGALQQTRSNRATRRTFLYDLLTRLRNFCCSHGFARPRKAASHNSTMGGRGQLVFHHDQLCVSRQKPIVPCRHWQCRLCLLMPDHLHAIIAFPRDPGMETTVKNWKKFVAGKHGVDWQRDFFDHRFRDHHELDEKTSYILMNPVRKGLCQRAEDWVWVYRPNDRPPPRW